MDPWSSWDADEQMRAQQQRVSDERDRRAIAELLAARREARAAALVAGSGYQCEQVSNYDGGEYEGVFAVPAIAYDEASVDPMRSALESAARAIITEQRFAAIRVTVQRAALEPGWEQDLVRRLFDEHASSADPKALLALLPTAATTNPTAARGDDVDAGHDTVRDAT